MLWSIGYALLARRGARPIAWEDWRAIDAAKREHGRESNSSRSTRFSPRGYPGRLGRDVRCRLIGTSGGQYRAGQNERQSGDIPRGQRFTQDDHARR